MELIACCTLAANLPVLLDLGDAEDSGEVLTTVKEQLRALPNRGIGYGVLRYLRDGTAGGLERMPEAEISFNYLGQLDQAVQDSSAFRMAPERGGRGRSPRALRGHLLDVSAFIAHGRLAVSWSFSDRTHRRETIEEIAEQYIEELRRLISHCLSQEGDTYTPSDFPLANIQQGQLESIAAKLKGKKS